MLTVTYDARDANRLAAFWAGMLGREAVEDGDGVLLPGSETQLALRFARRDVTMARPNLMHFHLTSASQADQDQKVAAALELGATHLDIGQRPEEGHVVLADPEGYEFDVIEPGNNYLAGTGLLGEIACTGSREVGLFWSAALGWPLVWDEGEETAIQSPAGGTKVAWGGPSETPKEPFNRQRFELTTSGADQIDRLLTLGARRLEPAPDGAVLLADPDGNEFSVRAG